MVSGYRNALNYKRKIFLLTVKCRPVGRHIFLLLIVKGNLAHQKFLGFEDYRQRLGDFFQLAGGRPTTDHQEKYRQRAI